MYLATYPGGVLGLVGGGWVPEGEAQLSSKYDADRIISCSPPLFFLSTLRIRVLISEFYVLTHITTRIQIHTYFLVRKLDLYLYEETSRS